MSAEAALPRALRQLGMPRVPQFLPTSAGASSTQIQGYGAFLYAWIDAQNVGEGWGQLPSELAELLGQLHRLTPEIVQAVPALPFAPDTNCG